MSRDDLYRDEWQLCGKVIERINEDPVLSRRVTVHPIHVKFGQFANDPRLGVSGQVSDTVETETRQTSSCYRCHLSDSFSQQVCTGYRVNDHPKNRPIPYISLSNPPASLIAEGRLSQRTVFDVGPADVQYQLLKRLRSQSEPPTAVRTQYGFQPVEVVHSADVTVEVVYLREWFSHNDVPEHVRAVRCGNTELIEDRHDPVYTSAVIRCEFLDRYGYTSQAQKAFALRDPTLCVCCYRRVVIARLTKEDERPPSRLSRLYDRLARRIRETAGFARGLIPRSGWFNLDDDSDEHFRQEPLVERPTSR